VRHTYEDLLTEMEQTPTSSEVLATMLSTFRKVTTSYWTGLFHCYDIPDMPRTNNSLEQFFGSARYHERRATGRKQASPGFGQTKYRALAERAKAYLVGLHCSDLESH
jgi:hypothetical protein